MLPKKHNHNKLLLAEFENGNQKAFRKLFELFWESMYFNAKVIVGNEDVAKDIVQDIWVNLWEKEKISKSGIFKPMFLKRYNMVVITI